MDWDRKRLVDFNAGKNQLVLFDWSINSRAIDAKMDRFVFEEKIHFSGIVFLFYIYLLSCLCC